jgi:glycine cleavage system H protein
MSFAVLACTGLDKPEGSVAREVAIRLAEETGAEIICPVVLNRTPARYKKALADDRLVVVDGCATQCASKLAATAGKKPTYKVLVSDVLKQSGAALSPELRLGPDGLELAGQIIDEIRTATALVPAEAGEDPEAAGRGAAEPAVAPAEAEAVFEAPSEFIVVVYDKYEFRIPANGFYFNTNDVWAQVSGTRARVGISDYMQQRLTDITYVDPPKLGTKVEQFGELGIVESTKANFEVVSPVSGVVLRINDEVYDSPESINEDPYGSWIVEVELTAWEEDQMLLIDGQSYARDVEQKAAEY